MHEIILTAKFSRSRVYYLYHTSGDFHFLWECLQVLLLAYRGTANQPGALSNLRQQINRTLGLTEQARPIVSQINLWFTLSRHSWLQQLVPNSRWNHHQRPSPMIKLKSGLYPQPSQVHSRDKGNAKNTKTNCMICTVHFCMLASYMLISIMQLNLRKDSKLYDCGSTGSSTFLEQTTKILLMRL